MNILLWLIFGGIAGWLASVILGTDGEIGLLGNVVVGIAGAIIGGWISHHLGLDVEEGPGAERPTSLLSFIWATLGAIILLVALNLIF